MRILTNLSKAELNQLTSQPTAKAMIEKVKSEGIYIPEGDAKAAAQFTAQRQSEKRGDSLEISDKGLTALKNSVLNKLIILKKQIITLKVYIIMPYT